MTKLQRLFLLMIIIIATVVANAQEQPTRTYAGGGISFTGSTAENEGQRPTFVGAYFDSAYDLRHGFQSRFFGEYRRRPTVKNLFTGDDGPFEATSELRYGGALVYHFRNEGFARPFVSGGIMGLRHFFRTTGEPGYHHGGGYGSPSGNIYQYNSSVNPLLTVGAGLGKADEIKFTKYFADTYASSRLRGFGAEYTHTQKLSGRLHLRIGFRATRWSFQEAGEHYTEKAGEFSGSVGFQIQ